MRRRVGRQEFHEDCAPRRVLELFGSKWTSMILHVLHTELGGSARTGVLLRSLPGISKKMLTQTLRSMEAGGLVERRVHGTVPPAVDYTVTPLGRRFVEPIDLLYDWARTNADALDAFVEKFNSKRRRPQSARSRVTRKMSVSAV
jgi:DNA-binding HxlR family transcriptional regulator